MSLLIIAVVALLLGVAGVRASRGSYVSIALVTLAVSYYAFTR